METLHAITDLARIPAPVALAVGVFDGVHLGHRAVIQRALDGARAFGGCAVAATFSPHPARVLAPDRAPRMLTCTAHKLRQIAALGVGHTLVIPFDAALAATPPESFIQQLAAACDLREICVGEDWTFGKARAGNLPLLARLGADLGFSAIGVPAVLDGGQTISSTWIRSAVEAGDLTTAARLLGRPYSLFGKIVRGAQLGRQLGFPTANLDFQNEQLPPNGVYAVTADGLRGVANLGLRPTLQSPTPRRVFEAHFFDFDSDLYDRELEISLHQFLRPEQRFESLDALRAQIAADAVTARSFFHRS